MIKNIATRNKGTSLSKRELERGLHQPGRSGVHNLAEQCATDIAVDRGRSEEIRVIERVKSLQPKLKRPGFAELERLQQSQVEIQRPRTIERPARGVSRSPQCVYAESRRVEIWQAI